MSNGRVAECAEPSGVCCRVGGDPVSDCLDDVAMARCAILLTTDQEGAETDRLGECGLSARVSGTWLCGQRAAQ